jgi:hypothetical protein
MFIQRNTFCRSCVFDPVEGTNFDFCITTKSKRFFELKLTEERFGTAKADESHLTKFQNIYLPKMEGKPKPGSARPSSLI